MIRFLLDDKAPEGEDVYSINWAPYIGADTLAGIPTAIVVEGTILVDTLSNPDTHTTNFWVRGGIKGEVARAFIHADTTVGRELDAEIIIGVR